MVHSDREILVKFKVEMGRVHSVIVSNGANLFALRYLLSLPHLDPVEMGIEGINEFQLPVFDPGVADDDHVSPGRMDVPGKHNQAVADRVDGFPKAAGTASVCYKPILPHVATRSKTPGFVIPLAIGGGDRKIKPLGCLGNALGGGHAAPPPKKDQQQQKMEVLWTHGQ